jgi:hypothetical protein
MAGLEELKKKLQPLLFDDPDRGGASTRVPLPEETCDSYAVSTPWYSWFIAHWYLQL